MGVDSSTPANLKEEGIFKGGFLLLVLLFLKNLLCVGDYFLKKANHHWPFTQMDGKLLLYQHLQSI